MLVKRREELLLKFWLLGSVLKVLAWLANASQK